MSESRKGREDNASAVSVLDAAVGHALTEPEWMQAKIALLEYVTILRRWAAEAGGKEPVPQLPQAA